MHPCQHCKAPWYHHMHFGCHRHDIRRKNQSTKEFKAHICSHSSRCHHYHYCNVDCVLFHNVTCYTNSLLSRIHVTTAELLDIITSHVCHRRDIREVRVYQQRSAQSIMFETGLLRHGNNDTVRLNWVSSSSVGPNLLNLHQERAQIPINISKLHIQATNCNNMLHHPRHQLIKFSTIHQYVCGDDLLAYSVESNLLYSASFIDHHSQHRHEVNLNLPCQVNKKKLLLLHSINPQYLFLHNLIFWVLILNVNSWINQRAADSSWPILWVTWMWAM